MSFKSFSSKAGSQFWLSWRSQVLCAESGCVEQDFCTRGYSVTRRSFPGSQVHTQALQVCSAQHSTWGCSELEECASYPWTNTDQQKEFPCPCSVCLLHLGVTAGSKLTLYENKNLICRFWILSKGDCEEAKSVISSGVTNQNIGALAEQEKLTAWYLFIAPAAYNRSNFKMKTLSI